MADETDLVISITTVADTAGAEEAQAAVEDVAEAAQTEGAALTESGQAGQEAFAEVEQSAEQAGEAIEAIKPEIAISADTEGIDEARQAAEDLKEELADWEAAKISVEMSDIDLSSFSDFRTDIEKTEASMQEMGGVGKEAFTELKAPIAVTKEEISQNVGVLDRVKAAFSSFGTETKTAFTNFGADAKAAAGSLGELIQHIPGFSQLGGAITGLGAGTLGLVAAGFAAIGTAIGTAAKALEEFAVKQKAVSDLDVVLANTGQLTGEFRLKLQELADQFEETTGIGDERFLAVMATLVKFGATSENIDQLTQATINLSGAIGVDVERAATIMGKAMHGNVTMLQRYGITVDKNASDTEKLNQVMEQLATRGGNVLEARTRTISGQFNQVSIATGNFFEGLGNLISRSGVVQTAMEAMSTAINALANLFPKAVEQTSNLKNNFDPLRKSMGDAKEGADELSGSVDKVGGSAKKTKDALAEATEAIKANATAASNAVDASLKLAEAEIKLQVAQGKISKEEGQLRIQQLKEETELKKLLIEQDALLAQKAEIEKTITVPKEKAETKEFLAGLTKTQFEAVSPRRTAEDVVRQMERAEREVQRLEPMQGKTGSMLDFLVGVTTPGITPPTASPEEELEAAKKKRAALEPAFTAAKEVIKTKADAEDLQQAANQITKELDPKLKLIDAEIARIKVEIKAAEVTKEAGTIGRVTERREIAEKAEKDRQQEHDKVVKEEADTLKKELADTKRDLSLVEKVIKTRSTKGGHLSEYEASEVSSALQKGESPEQARRRLTQARISQEAALDSLESQRKRVERSVEPKPKEEKSEAWSLSVIDPLKTGIDKLTKENPAEKIVREMTNVVLKAHETQAQANARLQKQVSELERGLNRVNQREQVNKSGAN